MSDDVFKIDQFTIIGDIASGQVSDVFEAVQDGSGKHFALKLLRDDIVQNSMQKDSRRVLSQFKQEFKLGQLFEHPNLVHVHEIQFKVQTLLPVKEPIAYFTMDYFRSQNLKAAMSSDPWELSVDCRRCSSRSARRWGMCTPRDGCIETSSPTTCC